MDNKEKQKYYSKGKFFDTFEEMMEYSNEWNNKEIDQESCKHILDLLCRDIFLNISIYGEELTNKQFSEMTEQVFFDFTTNLFNFYHDKNAPEKSQEPKKME